MKSFCFYRWLGKLTSTLVLLSGCRQKPDAPDKTALLLAQTLKPAIYHRDGLPYALPYRLFVPQGYTAKKRYPLVVYLHGAGGRGDDNVRHLSDDVAELISERVQALGEFFVLAPQCPLGDEWVNRHDSVPFHNYDQSKVPESPASLMTFEVIEQLKASYSIEPERLYVTGYSMGGSGTWDFVTRHPRIFAAAVPVTGVNDPSRASTLSGLSVWAFHGEKDGVSPVENTRTMVRRLRELGAEIRFSELPNVGHDSNRFVYHDLDLYRWMLSQRRRETLVDETR
jgi:predicted peptidase